ncbi:hypothetical protein LRS05_03400 [Flavobacterium sp. J372]|uniref:hypothetical protein n=1 Tax=Flavobacterium sp. J372 TaxID=2898436 RepID=UPI0021512366|nr:hypothetical protein [Flavobacterium sp. J372]MCR5861249.1 hypothetical protein [Flavobacterium sp. J372]
MYYLFGTMVFGTIIGAILLRTKKSWLKDLGWGICFGSAVAFVAVTSFTIWLYYNFPK